MVWYNMFKLSGNTSLLYYDDYTSNKVACSKPNKQTFKCSVYKNGEIIKSMSDSRKIKFSRIFKKFREQSAEQSPA